MYKKKMSMFGSIFLNEADPPSSYQIADDKKTNSPAASATKGASSSYQMGGDSPNDSANSASPTGGDSSYQIDDKSSPAGGDGMSMGGATGADDQSNPNASYQMGGDTGGAAGGNQQPDGGMGDDGMGDDMGGDSYGDDGTGMGDEPPGDGTESDLTDGSQDNLKKLMLIDEYKELYSLTTDLNKSVEECKKFLIFMN